MKNDAEDTADYKDLVKSDSAAKEFCMNNFYNQIFENQGGDIPTEEIATLSGAIESKMTRVGELGVEIATMKNDAEDTVEALAEDQEFVADLEKICAEKSGIHDSEKAEQGDNYDKAIPSAAALRVEEWARGRQVLRAWRSLCDNMVARLDTLHEAEATSYMQEISG